MKSTSSSGSTASRSGVVIALQCEGISAQSDRLGRARNPLRLSAVAKAQLVYFTDECRETLRVFFFG
jgi:hypothetical protein